jgi:protein-S-isoprenylcysteine O-methyltransferase Ste14
VRTVELVFGIGWAAFWIYWLAAAIPTKRGRRSWSREIAVRIVLVALIVLLARLGVFRSYHGVHTDPWRAAIGLALWATGLLFAIWARVHLGRNWGSPMTEKADPELVTSGPYGLVRHPIYSGILLGLLGTAVGLNWWWLVIVVLPSIYFIYAATVEERFLAEQFPETYPAYKRSTKMLVPFVF